MKNLIIKSEKNVIYFESTRRLSYLKKNMYFLMSPDLVIKHWELNKNLIFIVLFMYSTQIAKIKLKFLKSSTTVSSETLIVHERLCFGEGGSLCFS